MYHPGSGYLGDDNCSGACSGDWEKRMGGDERVFCTCNCTGAWIVTIVR